MTNVLSRALPPPSNWQDFEKLCFDLYRRIWKTNDAAMNGRSGQGQHGVDIYGTDRTESKFCGVQCKGKDQDYNTPLTRPELREEVAKAKTFAPPLDVFIVATSAPNDALLQTLAREITAEHKPLGLFEVRVEGWTQLRLKIEDHSDLLEKYFADFAPISIESRVADVLTSIVKRDGEATRALVMTQSARVLAPSEPTDPADLLQVRIAELAKITNEGSPATALRAFERILADEGANASPRNRYRLKGNIGFARLMLGHKQNAIDEMRAAYAEDPHWPGAIATLANAESLAGNREKAFTLAKQALASGEKLFQAAAVLVENAPQDMTLEEVQALVPNELLNSYEVLMTLAYRAGEANEPEKRRQFLDRLVAINAEDWRGQAAQAEMLLESVFTVQGLAFTHDVPAALVANLEQAVVLLRSAWAKVRKRENARIGAYIAANLLSALDLSGLDDEHQTVLAEGLEAAPDFPPLLRVYAVSMMHADNWAAAEKALDSIPKDQTDPQDELFKVQIRIAAGKFEEAISEGRRIEQEIKTGRTAEVAGALQLEAMVRVGRSDAALKEVLARWPQSIVMRSVVHNLLPDDSPLRPELIGEIGILSAAMDSPQDRMHAADALYSAKQFSRAADTYKGLYGVDHDTSALNRALKCLLFADRRREARELFDQLSPDLKATTRYADLGVSIYEQVGLLGTAREIIEAALQSDDTIKRRLHWFGLCERLGDENAVKNWLNTIPESQEGTPQDLMALAIAIDRHTADPKAFPIAYRALRAGFNEAHIHLAYMFGLFLGGRASRRNIPKPDVVWTDTAVTLKERGGPRTIVRILESEAHPIIERGEIAPSAELGPKLIGLKTGDTVEVPHMGLEPITFEIAEIQNKYLHAHFRSMQQFESMFPGHKAFGSFTIDETKGDDKFKPLFDAVRQRGEHSQEIANLYKSGQFPLAMVTKVSGIDAVGIWEAFSVQTDIGILTCAGVAPEFEAARRALAEKKSAVIDPITLFGISKMGIADAMRGAFAELMVVQTTIDLFRRLVHERREEVGRRQGTLGWTGTHYQMVEMTPEVAESRVVDAQTALDFALTLRLVPAEATVDAAVPPEVAELFKDIDPSFLDSLFASQSTGCLLYCEDQPMRVVARTMLNVEGIWTQAAAQSAFQQQSMTRTQYDDVVQALVRHSYRFTMFDHLNFLHVIVRDGWTIGAKAQPFVALLALPTNEQESVKLFLSDLMIAAWFRSPNVETYISLFAALLVAFKATRSTDDLFALWNDAFGKLERKLVVRSYFRNLSRRLRSSSSMVPVRLEMDRGGAQGRNLADSVFKALEYAFTDALAALPTKVESPPQLES